MQNIPFIQIDAHGVHFLAERPEPHTPGQHDYSKDPFRLSVLPGHLGIELHGEKFSVKKNLTIDEALSLVLLLTFAIREETYAKGLK
ncbi:MAG: hypothetical protein K9K38_21725 [Rhodoferax sp.]|nr:hypothetical protein [Rhodoferax sp.]